MLLLTFFGHDKKGRAFNLCFASTKCKLHAGNVLIDLVPEIKLRHVDSQRDINSVTGDIN